MTAIEFILKSVLRFLLMSKKSCTYRHRRCTLLFSVSFQKVLKLVRYFFSDEILLFVIFFILFFVFLFFTVAVVVVVIVVLLLLYRSVWGAQWRSGQGTTLQTGRSRVRFPTVSLEFFNDIILPFALWPLGRLSL